MTPAQFYQGRRVMITGGLGFIGSNLAQRLVQLGADVLLVDSLIPDYGGNLFNIAGIESQVRVNVADVRQASTMNYLVRDREVIFNLAGQVSHLVRANHHMLWKTGGHCAGFGHGQPAGELLGRLVGVGGFVNVGCRHLEWDTQTGQ